MGVGKLGVWVEESWAFGVAEWVSWVNVKVRSPMEHFDRENGNTSSALNYDLITVKLIFEPTCIDIPIYPRLVYPEDPIQ